MKITIFGAGYVGLVTGVCLADAGNDVVGYDVDADKVARLGRGECPIFEPGLSDLLQTNLASRRFRVTADLPSAVRHAEIIFIAIGTPPRDDGSADLSMIESAVVEIARHVSRRTILVMKSTVPVGTCARVEQLVRPIAEHPIVVVSNPEFLKEGTAVDNFLRPDRVVIGSEDADAAEAMRELYLPFVRNQHPILVVRRAAAEMIKYAANCYLSTRISFINQIANLCAALGIDVDEVRAGIGRDARIGPHFMYPGIGYGGSCFPKDVQALHHVATSAGVEADLLAAVHNVNERQKSLLLERLRAHFQGELGGRTFAVWGVAFKPNTDDIREAPAMTTIRGLLAAGAKVRVHDPKAMPNLLAEVERWELERGRSAAGDRAPQSESSGSRVRPGEELTCCVDAYDALTGADALIVCTEWNEFRSPDFERVRATLRQPLVFDGRNVFSPSLMRRHGFTYYSIGRPTVRGPGGRGIP